MSMNELSLSKRTFLGGLVGLIMTIVTMSSAWANDWWIDVRNDRVTKIVRAIDEGKDPNILNHQGHTSLIYAFREGALKSFDALAQHPKVDINQRNSYHETPIMYAALANDMARVQQLVARGAEVNNLGWAPIHYAAIKGNAEIVAYLLEQGAWPNSPAPDGSSPLLMAVNAGSYASVEALLAAGADPYAVNFENISAMDMAKANKNKRMIELLSGN